MRGLVLQCHEVYGTCAVLCYSVTKCMVRSNQSDWETWIKERAGEFGTLIRVRIGLSDIHGTVRDFGLDGILD